MIPSLWLCHCWVISDCWQILRLLNVELDFCARDLSQSWKTSHPNCSCCLARNSSGNALTSCSPGFLVCHVDDLLLWHKYLVLSLIFLKILGEEYEYEWVRCASQVLHAQSFPRQSVALVMVAKFATAESNCAQNGNNKTIKLGPTVQTLSHVGHSSWPGGASKCQCNALLQLECFIQTKWLPAEVTI